MKTIKNKREISVSLGSLYTYIHKYVHKYKSTTAVLYRFITKTLPQLICSLAYIILLLLIKTLLLLAYTTAVSMYLFMKYYILFSNNTRIVRY